MPWNQTNYTEPVSGAGVAEIATDNFGGLRYQVMKLDGGAPGLSAPISGTVANGLLVDVSRIQAGSNTIGNVGVVSVSGGVISTANSTTATLGANAQFIGGSEDVHHYEAVEVSIYSLHASQTTGGVELQWSTDNSNWDIKEVWTYAASGNFSICTRPKGQWFRLVYQNGGTAQTVFRVQTSYSWVSPFSNHHQENERITINGVSYKVKWSGINATAAGDNTVVAAVPLKKLRVLSIAFVTDGALTISFKSGANVLIQPMAFAKNGGPGLNLQPSGYFCETNAGEAFIMNLSSSQNVRGMLNYVEL